MKTGDLVRLTSDAMERQLPEQNSEVRGVVMEIFREDGTVLIQRDGSQRRERWDPQFWEVVKRATPDSATRCLNAAKGLRKIQAWLDGAGELPSELSELVTEAAVLLELHGRTPSHQTSAAPSDLRESPTLLKQDVEVSEVPQLRLKPDIAGITPFEKRNSRL